MNEPEVYDDLPKVIVSIMDLVFMLWLQTPGFFLQRKLLHITTLSIWKSLQSFKAGYKLPILPKHTEVKMTESMTQWRGEKKKQSFLALSAIWETTISLKERSELTSTANALS